MYYGSWNPWKDAFGRVTGEADRGFGVPSSVCPGLGKGTRGKEGEVGSSPEVGPDVFRG